MPIVTPPIMTRLKVKQSNFVAGRGPCAAPVAVVLHGGQFTVGEIDAMHCRTNNTPHAHQSFHFAVDAQVVHAYVGLDDTALAFNGAEAAPAGLTPCPGGSPDQSTINILVNWPKSIADDDCALVNLPDCAALCQLLAYLFNEIGVVPSAATLLAATGELPSLDIAELLTCVNATIANAPTTAPTTVADLYALLRASGVLP